MSSSTTAPGHNSEGHSFHYPTEGTWPARLDAWLTAYNTYADSSIQGQKDVMNAMEGKAFERHGKLIRDIQASFGIEPEARGTTDKSSLKAFQDSETRLWDMLAHPKETVQKQFDRTSKMNDTSKLTDEEVAEVLELYERWLPPDALRRAGYVARWATEALKSLTLPSATKEDALRKTRHSSSAREVLEATWEWFINKDGGAAKDALVKRWSTILDPAPEGEISTA